MTAPKHQRGPGAPSSAVPALAGFTFLSVVAPPFYVLSLYLEFFSNGNDINWVNDFLGGGIGWIVLMVAGIIYPASRGKVWAIWLIRILSIPALLGLLGAIIGDAALYFQSPASQRGFAVFIFWFPLAPLLVAAFFLIDGLVHQPWFDPNAAPEEIGPSRGTIGDFNKQAGMDAAGRLSPEKLAAALAAPAPPARWLCYVAPPIAAARLRRWWYVALFTPICLAALILAVFIPLRAILVYGLMGGFADRLRSVQAYRKIVAESQADTIAPLNPSKT